MAVPETTIFLLLIANFYVSALNPLSSWTICPRSRSDMNDCLAGASQGAVRGLKNGNSKLGILPLDPLHLDLLHIYQATGPVAIDLKFRDLDITGVSGTVVDKFIAEWDKVHLEAQTHFENPHMLNTVGRYEISGKVLLLPIQGNGTCNITLENFRSNFTLDGIKVKKSGQVHAHINEVKFFSGTSKMHINLANLFNGNKALGDNMNLFLNQNWKEILEDLKPAISKAMGAAIEQRANLVFDKIPLNKLAPL